jgi:hypothetical protein
MPLTGVLLATLTWLLPLAGLTLAGVFFVHRLH